MASLCRGAPRKTFYLDLYVIRGSNPLRWRSDELQSIVHTRLVEHASPLVAEGVLILDALGAIGRKPDFLVYVDGEGARGALRGLAARICGGELSVWPTSRLHSITLSARASSVRGTSRWSAFIVLRLMTNSNLVGCWTGKSRGLSPLRMRSTYEAACRYVSSISIP
jgi:hypothetical protein